MKAPLRTLKAKWQVSYLKRLAAQKNPLTARQYRILTLLDLPVDKYLHDVMVEWGEKSRAIMEEQHEVVAGIIAVVADRMHTEMAWDEAFERESYADPTPTEGRKPLFKRLIFSAATCIIALAIALPLALSGSGAGGSSPDGNGSFETSNPDNGLTGGETSTDAGKLYIAGDAKILHGGNGGKYFEELHAEMLERDDLIIFKNILDEGQSTIDVYNDEGRELLSYALLSFIPDIVVNGEYIAFDIDYRVRFVQKYMFAKCDDYEHFTDSFHVCGIDVQYKILHPEMTGVPSYALLRFVYCGYDCFLEARSLDVETEDGVWTTVTELSVENLILLMKDLFSNQ